MILNTIFFWIASQATNDKFTQITDNLRLWIASQARNDGWHTLSFLTVCFFMPIRNDDAC